MTHDQQRPKYVPRPASTQKVEFPVELRPLLEKLAKNAHEVWASQRMNEGWTYGKNRDDNLKQHPCLVPYDELTDLEKEYDRQMSKETIKLMLCSGFKIVPDDH